MTRDQETPRIRGVSLVVELTLMLPRRSERVILDETAQSGDTQQLEEQDNLLNATSKNNLQNRPYVKTISPRHTR
jgi:hypothetical protein